MGMGSVSFYGLHNMIPTAKPELLWLMFSSSASALFFFSFNYFAGKVLMGRG